MSERIPLPFPTGWFCVLDAADLAPGQVDSVHAFGRDLVLCDGDGPIDLLRRFYAQFHPNETSRSSRGHTPEG